MEDQNVNEEMVENETPQAEAPTETIKAQAQPPVEEQPTVLLGTISYKNEDDYENFLYKMDLNQALFVLIATANYGQAKGLYNLSESELVSRAIKTIRKNSQPAQPADAVVAEEVNSEEPSEVSE